MVKTAIILAGGLGTRLREVVSDLPKPMVLINNRPFLEYQLDYWIEQGITKFILSVGYLKDSIINHFGRNYHGAEIDYVVESEPLGTGGGLLLAANNLDEVFLVLNGDTYIEVDLDNFYNFHIKSKSIWTIALFSTSNFNRFLGLDICQNGEIKSLKQQNKSSTGLANGGVYLIDPIALNEIGYYSGDNASLENQLIPSFISNGGKLFGQKCLGKFIDIGLPEDYFRAKDVLPK
jgi:D-glycero-alpha-D-manno-heptose 1-phosphate guanylyltransferase